MVDTGAVKFPGNGRDSGCTGNKTAPWWRGPERERIHRVSHTVSLRPHL